MKSLSVAVACAVVAATACAEEAAEKAEGEGEAAVEAIATNKPASRVSFTTLPLCRLVEGRAEVRKPGGEWLVAEEGKFYPLGTSFRTAEGGRLDLAFGSDSIVSIGACSEFGTRAQALGRPSRTVVLVRGTLDLSLPDNLPEGAFFVTTMGFVVKNPAGKSRYVLEDKGDGESVRVLCKTGTMGVQGRHFEIPAMHSANEAIIRTSHDHLVTVLKGTSGDYKVVLDRGVQTKEEIGDDGQVKKTVAKSTAEWSLSPATRVLISRAVPSIGERMSVHIMAFDAAGERKSECYFSEGRAEVNSGELVARDKADSEELAKRAAEATENVPVSDAEASGENKAETSASENNEQ